jgi:hypothetical protein
LAIAALLHSVPSNGLSKWQSLQSTEKFLKAYIAKQGQKYPWSHDVVELACVGERLGLRGLAYKDLVEVQCTTHVRYDKSLVTVREAVDAFSAGLRICSSVAVGLGFPYDMQ